MFGWLRRRKTAAADSAGAMLRPEITAVSAPAPRQSETRAAPAAPVAAARQQSRAHLKVGSSVVPPKGYKEPAPARGMIAVEIAPPRRVSTAVVVRMLADGRRVMARINGSARSCWYTRREDGTYRLESAPRTRAPRLVLGLDLGPAAHEPQGRLAR
jgi:hypothetical protein